jgi:hypothetical protein
MAKQKKQNYNFVVNPLANNRLEDDITVTVQAASESDAWDAYAVKVQSDEALASQTLIYSQRFSITEIEEPK